MRRTAPAEHGLAGTYNYVPRVATRYACGDLKVATCGAILINNTRWQTWWRKRNRLERGLYRGPAAFSVTIATCQQQSVFTDATSVDWYRKMLEDAARNTGFSLLAYCFMPDHLHLLVEASDGSDLARFMKAFKQASSFDHKQRTGRLLWQRSYYDHVLRGSDELQPAIEYILGNPVRAGLVQDPAAYPFTGGELLADMLVAT
jgi:putative transposase